MGVLCLVPVLLFSKMCPSSFEIRDLVAFFNCLSDVWWLNVLCLFSRCRWLVCIVVFPDHAH